MSIAMPKKRKPLPQPDPEPVNPWPAALRAWRTTNGLDQAEAAALAHISQSQWSLFENGKRIPTRPVAHLLSLLISGKLK